jgi:formate-dependent nitrite reductase membrane component NrfD
MNSRHRELFADWLIVAGGIALFVSLFLTWSHQFSAPFLAQFGSSSQLQGVPHNPTAWQVYSAVDVLLALLAIALVAIALVGGRRVRIVALVASAIALAFTLHALSRPPTNGANIFNPALSVPSYFPNDPTAGPGVTVALVGLGVALIGLALSFTAD